MEIKWFMLKGLKPNSQKIKDPHVQYIDGLRIKTYIHVFSSVFPLDIDKFKEHHYVNLSERFCWETYARSCFFHFIFLSFWQIMGR